MKPKLIKIKKTSFLLFTLTFLSLCNGCTKNKLPPLPSEKIEMPEGNPFAIAVPNKKDLSQEDYVNLQNELRKIDLSAYLKKIYPQDQGLCEFSDFLTRSSRGATQTIIDVEKGLLPEQKLIKIGNGGNRCVVTRATYGHVYTEFLPKIQKALEDSGFNGYFLYQKGGIPNPTGKEVACAAVPYSFKIFTMMEAYRLGFTNVLWIDSAILPLQDPTPCFERIEKQGSFLTSYKRRKRSARFILPQTRKILLEETGTDVLTARYLSMNVFGLKMDSLETQKLIKTFYKLAEMGTPFFSCFPEEFVIAAIVAHPEFAKWHQLPPKKFVTRAEKTDSMEDPVAAKEKGYLFYHLRH